MAFNFTQKVPFQHIYDHAKTKGLSEDALELLPKKWEKLGKVVVIKLPGLSQWPKEMQEVDYKWQFDELSKVGETFAAVLKAATVVVDIGGVMGELREPSIQIIHGMDTETVHIENGVKYKFDVSKIMFSSGNVDERIKMGRTPMAGETVVDMFAGIGYFSLPIGKYSGASVVYGVEKNETAFRYMWENISLNQLTEKVSPVLGDNRHTGMSDVANRIIMGYIKGTMGFLPTAFSLLKPEGGMIHYHDTFGSGNPAESTEEQIRDMAGENGYDVKDMKYRNIKSFAPNVEHGVFDITLG